MNKHFVFLVSCLTFILGMAIMSIFLNKETKELSRINNILLINHTRLINETRDSLNKYQQLTNAQLEYIESVDNIVEIIGEDFYGLDRWRDFAKGENK